MYTYEVTDNPPMAKIFYDNQIIDVVGPWDEVSSAETWAEAYVNKSNLGIS